MLRKQAQLKKLAQKIHKAKSLILTTHKMCDGDGLGSMLGMYHALRKIGKSVRAVSVDQVSSKYQFLSPEKHIQNFSKDNIVLKPTDMALIFDTNDCRRIQPFYEELQKHTNDIIYIDHHPILTKGPKPTAQSIVDISSASTGEICYFLLKQMGVKMDTAIATPLYTSIVFDTQRFQFIKNSANSHTICADLLKYVKNHQTIYTWLFGFNSRQKINLFCQVMKQTEYFYQDRVAIMEIKEQELKKNKLSIEDACDFLDTTLQVRSTLLSILIVQRAKNRYKLSFRSKSRDVSKLAEIFGGGGHKTSSGASLVNYLKDPKKEILKAVAPLTK